MNKLLLAACLAALSSSAAFAAFVPCVPQGSDQIVSAGIPLTAMFLCSPSVTAGNLAGDGITLQAIQLRATVAIQSVGALAGEFQSALAVVTNTAGFNNPGPLACSGVVAPNGTLAGGPVSAVSAWTPIPCVDEVPAFLVSVMGAPNGGAALPQSAVAMVEYDTIACPEVPEPGSLVLFGSALAALVGQVRRHRR